MNIFTDKHISPQNLSETFFYMNLILIEIQSKIYLCILAFIVLGLGGWKFINKQTHNYHFFSFHDFFIKSCSYSYFLTSLIFLFFGELNEVGDVC